MKASKDLYELDILRAIQVNFLDERRESVGVLDPYVSLFEYFINNRADELTKTLLHKETFEKLMRLTGISGKINKRALCVIFAELMDPRKEWGLTCAT